MWKLRLTALALPLAAWPCFSQCNTHPLHPNLLPPCPTIMDKLSQAADASGEFKKNAAVMNEQTGDARARYWKLFPNGPGIDGAEAAYMQQLENKDLYYLMLSLPEGVTGRTALMANYIGMNASSTVDSLHSFPKNVDGGIRPFAFPLFVAWVDALRRSDGREKDGAMASPMLIAKAVQDKSNFRRAYEQARNWAEFMSSGLDVSKYITPEAYIVNQMESGVSQTLARSKPSDLPDPAAATRDLYSQLVKDFGEKEVLAAADTVLHTPKNSMGGLAKRADVVIGTFVTSPSPNPWVLFLTELTNRSARTYAVAICMDRNNLLGGEAAATFYTKAHWEGALSNYNQVVAKYGEANVLSAAGKLKDVPKGDNGLRGDLQAKGTIVWFLALLKEPKTVLPEVAYFKAGSYNPRWLGKAVQICGTVSRVDLDKKGFPQYATIHFKESQDDHLTVFTPNSDMWQESYGENFAGLIGKPIEVWGQVEEWRNGGGVRVLTSHQLKVISAEELANTRESRPE